MSKPAEGFQSLEPMSKEEREARKVFRRAEAKKAMTEYATAEQAFANNRERLKAERLAREAIEPAPTPKKKKAKATKS